MCGIPKPPLCQMTFRTPRYIWVPRPQSCHCSSTGLLDPICKGLTGPEGSAHLTCSAGRSARAGGLHADICTLEVSCAVQELLDGYRETGVAYLDLSYFPTDALTEPGPAACVAGDLKLVPGQFGMPSLVTCCPNPPSSHVPLCKQSMPIAHFNTQLCA